MREESDDQRGTDTCGFCDSPASKKCGACKQISYCSREHQTEHWKVHRKLCKPFTSKKDETKGRYLVAVRDIKCNEVIFKEECLVIGPKFVSPKPICLGCLKPIDVGVAADSSSKCVKCLWPICSSECVGIATNHQVAECDFLAADKRKTKSYKYELITPIRCWLQKRYNKEKWNLISNMESHLERRKEGTEIYREIQDLYECLRESILKNLPKKEIIPQKEFHRICGILDVNSLDVGSNATDGDLSALYPTFSTLEHNCLPNVKISIHKFQLVVRSSRSISKDENLSTMYTNVLWGTQVRQQHLLNTKYFTCSCTRCADPLELGTHFSSIKCLQDNCNNGYLLLKDPLAANSSWKCSHCVVTMSWEDVNDITSRLSDEVEQITQQINPNVIVVQSLLQKLLSVLHPNHYNCFSLKHLLIQLYGHKAGYPYPQMNCETLNRKIEYCRELLFSLSRLDPTGSRVPLYSAIANYELSSAMLETMKRTLTETMNLPLIQNDGAQAKRILTAAVALLSDTKANDASLIPRLIYSCKCLYKEIEDVMQGQCSIVVDNNLIN